MGLKLFEVSSKSEEKVRKTTSEADGVFMSCSTAHIVFKKLDHRLFVVA